MSGTEQWINRRGRSVFAWIKHHGSDKGFIPKPAVESTQAQPGSDEKIDVLRKRVRSGQSLWHEDDVAFFKRGKEGFWYGSELPGIFERGETVRPADSSGDAEDGSDADDC